MAYIRKVKAGWRVEIERKGVRTSATFPLKATATQWAAQEESAILSGQRKLYSEKTVQDAIDRYEREVSSAKRGAHAEGLRFAALSRNFPDLVAKRLVDVDTDDLAKWRDKRLETVSRGTVSREINQFRAVWSIARDEWKWISHSPWRTLRSPGDPPPRKARSRWRMIKQLVRWLGYRTGQPPETGYQEVAYAYLIALRTAMRAGEVVGATRQDLDLVARTVDLGKHKTVETVGPRVVPLTPAGLRLFGVLANRPGKALWTINAEDLSALFRKARLSCGVNGITFRDSRAEALTMLARRVDVMRLAKISGHRDIRLLQETYYRETPEEIAAHLANRRALPPRPIGGTSG